ncbi:hypothetical protein ACW7GZ_14845 [Luteimonas sp. A537]
MDNFVLIVGVAFVLVGVWDVSRFLLAGRVPVRGSEESDVLKNGQTGKELRLVGSIANGCLGVVFVTVALHPSAPGWIAIAAIFFYVVLSAGIQLRRTGA